MGCSGTQRTCANHQRRSIWKESDIKMLTLSAPAKSPSLFVINRWDDPGAHFSRVKIPTACLIWPIWVGPIARSHIRQFILRVGSIRLGSECLCTAAVLSQCKVQWANIAAHCIGKNQRYVYCWQQCCIYILACVQLPKIQDKRPCFSDSRR